MFLLHILLVSFVALQWVCCAKKKKENAVIRSTKPKNRYESRVCFQDRNVDVKVDDSFLTSGYMTVDGKKPVQEKPDPELKKPAQVCSQVNTAVQQDMKQGNSQLLTAKPKDMAPVGHSSPTAGKGQ